MFHLPRVVLCLLAIALHLRLVVGHCKIVNVAARLDQPGTRSHGFVVDRHGKYPWHVGEPGDAGADAVFFSPVVEYVANPKFPCGQLVILPNGVDIPSALAQAEADGVATSAPDGSFEAQIFQVNRDGAGECTCEYDTSATAKSWNKCKTLINPPGIDGMWQSDRTNHTAKFQIPSSTVCRGGAFKDKCIIRIRCGWKSRFGGCFALKTPSSPKPLQLKVLGSQSTSNSNGGDVASLAAKVFSVMQSSGALVPLSKANKRSNHKVTRRSNASGASAPVDLVAAKVIELIKSSNMRVKQDKAAIVAQAYITSSSRS